MNYKSIRNLAVRIGLFTLILIIGTVAMLAVGELEGLALADLSDTAIQTLVTDHQGDIFVGVDHAGSTDIYHSSDAGYHWELVGPGPAAPVIALARYTLNHDVFFAGTAGGPVHTSHNFWRSVDGGQTWRKFYLSLPSHPDGLLPAVTALAIDPHQPGLLYVGTDGEGIYRFDVGADGDGYHQAGGAALRDGYVKALVAGSDRDYALTNEGLYVSTGSDWQQLGPLPERAVSFAAAAGDPQVLYIGGTSNGAYRSLDGGQSWDRISDGLEMTPGTALRVTGVAVAEPDPQHVVVATAFAVGGQLIGRSIYESHDAGNHWAKLADLDSVVTHLTFNNGVIYAATAKGLVRYSQPEGTPAGNALFWRSIWANPVVPQMFVLILTISLGGLVLLGRIEWLTGLQRKLT